MNQLHFDHALGGRRGGGDAREGHDRWRKRVGAKEGGDEEGRMAGWGKSRRGMVVAVCRRLGTMGRGWNGGGDITLEVVEDSQRRYLRLQCVNDH